MRRHLLALLLLLATGCTPADPARQVEALRAYYNAELSAAGFVVRDDPATGKQEIVLDVLLQWSGRDRLPGLTLDVSMGDATGREKAHRRHYVDTSQLDRGPGEQITIVLTDVPYQPGDGFFVEVRSSIPPAERSAYREFGP